KTTGSNRVNRGGGWTNDAVNCRSANRNNDAPGNRNDNLGFRLVSTSRSRWDAVHGSHPRAQGQVHLPSSRAGPPRPNNNRAPRVVGQKPKPASQSHLRNLLLPFASDFHTLRRAGAIHMRGTEFRRLK
ncbi:MAG: SUMF1/EgtB/PvdO family nonheme iron enzyme, partial [Blastocatellia bacterium]